MKAVPIERFGPLGEATVREVADPEAAPGEVVVDLAAIDVNYPDILYFEGKYQAVPPLPFVPGLAGAGRVAALGDGVSNLSVGQPVLVIPSHGTYAEKVAAPAEHCFPMPAEMPFATAAAFGLVYQTAWIALHARGGFVAGQRVLVLGASGGVGTAAVQLAKALGAAAVIAVTRGDEGAAVARQSGADHVIDVGGGDAREVLKREIASSTGGEGVDIVIDPVGGDLSAAALRTLAWSGRLVVIGFAAGAIPQVPANILLVKNIAVAGLQWTDYRTRAIQDVRSAQAAIFSLWQEGKLNPTISRTLPLERFAEALEDVRAGKGRGKIVLVPGEEA